MAKEVRKTIPLRWIGSSREVLRACPQAVRDEVGFALWHAELGRRHSSVKTLKGFGGASVQEIRADDPSGTYRAVYTVQLRGFIYVLHVFQKKSRSGIATPKHEIDLIRNRLEQARVHYETHGGER
jgi:phage-related protein